MLLFLLCVTVTISISSSCLVSINDIYLSNNNGTTIIVTATNNDPGADIFSYPGWIIYVDNNLFGKELVNYYGISSDQQFTITSNATTIQPAQSVSLHLELWTLFYEHKSCTFNSKGIIDIRNQTNMITTIEYPYVTCPATLESVYLNDPNGTSLIVTINNPDPNIELFNYPDIVVYIEQSEFIKTEFGQSDMRYGLGNSNQLTVTSNTTSIDEGENVSLHIELWIHIHDMIACTFNWNGTIELSPVTTTTITTTNTTESVTTGVICSAEDDSTSCADGTCQCAIGAKCKNEECVGFGNPNKGGGQFTFQVFLFLVASIFAIV